MQEGTFPLAKERRDFLTENARSNSSPIQFYPILCPICRSLSFPNGPSFLSFHKTPRLLHRGLKWILYETLARADRWQRWLDLFRQPLPTFHQIYVYFRSGWKIHFSSFFSFESKTLVTKDYSSLKDIFVRAYYLNMKETLEICIEMQKEVVLQRSRVVLDD